MGKYLALFLTLIVPFCAVADEDTPTTPSPYEAWEKANNINEEQLNLLVETMRERYPDVNWAAFGELSTDVKFSVARGILAEKAFEELSQKYIADIKSRGPVNEVSRSGLWDPPVRGTQSRELQKHEKKVKSLRKKLDRSLGRDNPDSSNKDDRTITYSVHSFDKKSDALYMEDEYPGSENWCETMCQQKDGTYAFKPNGKDCKPRKICMNVTPIPDDYEIASLTIEKEENLFTGKNTGVIHYFFDDIAKGTNNYHSVFLITKNADSLKYENNKFDAVIDLYLNTLVEVSNFAEHRKWQNQDRLDIKNGQILDAAQHEGLNTQDWESSHIPSSYGVALSHSASGIYTRTNRDNTREPTDETPQGDQFITK